MVKLRSHTLPVVWFKYYGDDIIINVYTHNSAQVLVNFNVLASILGGADTEQAIIMQPDCVTITF